MNFIGENFERKFTFFCYTFFAVAIALLITTVLYVLQGQYDALGR